MSSERFDLKNVKIEGNQHITDAEVMKMTQIEKGKNIFLIRKGKAAKAIKASSYAEDCSIKRQLPDTLLINVKERIYAAIIPYGDRYALIDPDGILISVRDERPPVTLIDGVKIKKMKLGEKIEVNRPKRLASSLSFLDQMRANDLVFRYVYIDSEGGMVVQIYKRMRATGKEATIRKHVKNGNFKLVLNDLQKKGKTVGTLKFIDEKFCSYNPNYKK